MLNKSKYKNRIIQKPFNTPEVDTINKKSNKKLAIKKNEPIKKDNKFFK